TVYCGSCPQIVSLAVVSSANQLLMRITRLACTNQGTAGTCDLTIDNCFHTGGYVVMPSNLVPGASQVERAAGFKSTISHRPCCSPDALISEAPKFGKFGLT